ncbi:MAG: tol-pal system protein YbgF [Desulfovibrio sp.]|nr:tol-pal system protein YbgF [Desulfovibrio sp.]
MRTFRSLYILSLAAVLPLGGCMGSTGGNRGMSLEQQVQQQDVQLRQLQPAQADAWNQIQALRQEVNTLKGQMDDLQNAGGARALVSRVKTHDEALRQVERSMALNLNLGEPMSGSAATAAPAAVPASSRPDYGMPTYGQTPEAAVSPATAAGVGYGAAATPAPQPAAAPSGSTWGQATPQPQARAEAPKKDISLALFDAGVNAYNARKYDEAQRSFSDFLKNYKTHSQAPEAQYYLAECYFQRNQFADAALAYDTVIKKYPSSSSAPGAYLKQGISFSKLNQGAAAKARMQELIKKYPNSPEAARAKAFLKNNK